MIRSIGPSSDTHVHDLKKKSEIFKIIFKFAHIPTHFDTSLCLTVNTSYHPFIVSTAGHIPSKRQILDKL